MPDFNEVFTYVFSALVVIVCIMGSIKVMYNKSKTVKSLDEFIDFVLSDKTLVLYLNKAIETLCKKDAEKYDSVEDFLDKEKFIINEKLQSYIVNSLNIPDEFKGFITVDNIFSVVDTILDHYNIYDIIEEYFNENVIKNQLEDKESSDEETE